VNEPTKPQETNRQETFEGEPAPLQMTTVDAAIPSVLVSGPKLPPYQAD